MLQELRRLREELTAAREAAEEEERSRKQKEDEVVLLQSNVAELQGRLEKQKELAQADLVAKEEVSSLCCHAATSTAN